jgi:predicted nucleotidyltransferase
MDEKKVVEIVKKYINFLRTNNLNIERAYLFGSYTKGIVNEDSDIDIAIVFKDLEDSFDMQVQLMKLRREIDTRIEPHPFEEADFNLSNPFAGEILSTGLQVV